MGKFDGRGIMSRNNNRNHEKAPLYKGVINPSREDLERLLNEYDETGEAPLRFAVWRSDNDPDGFTMKIDKPFDGARQSARASRGAPQRQPPRQAERQPPARGGRTYENRDARRQDPPFDDRPARHPDAGDYEDPWKDDLGGL